MLIAQRKKRKIDCFPRKPVDLQSKNFLLSSCWAYRLLISNFPTNRIVS
jgi:hypothetical protein